MTRLNDTIKSRIFLSKEVLNPLLFFKEEPLLFELLKSISMKPHLL
jgi:hypothetical protein